MKLLLTAVLTILSFTSYSQDKYNYTHFNKLTVVEGTEHVIATIDNMGKMGGVKSEYLLFINTISGEATQVDLPKDGYFQEIVQMKIDSLSINKIIVAAKSVDLDGKQGIDWNDPKQLIIISTDGKERTQITDSKLFVRNWIVNRQTGAIVITGHYDTNNNGKYDKTDKNEISIYDLKTLKLVSKI